MKISQVQPIGTNVWMYKTEETGERKYFYNSWESKQTTEIYSYRPEDDIADYSGIVDAVYDSYVIRKYLPLDPENPEEGIYRFWRLYILQ